MKLLMILLLAIITVPIYASNANWGTQKINTKYNTIKDIKLMQNTVSITIPSGSQLELIEATELNVIKVHLHKYKISPCPSSKQETDLELVEVEQLNSPDTTVGVNLTKGCRIEVFIDVQEYTTMSFLN